MTPIVWTFSEDLDQGCGILSLGLMAHAGVPFAPVQQNTYNDQVAGEADDWTWSREVDAPTLVKGAVVVHFTVSVLGAGVTVPGELEGSYGGVPLIFGAQYVETAAGNVFHAIAYAFIGDASAIDGNALELSLADAGLSALQDVNLAATVVFFNGIDQETAGVYNDVVSLNVYDDSLSLDPAPSGEEFDVVITAACQARIDDAETSALAITTERYTEAELAQDSEETLGNLAWYFCDASYNCACEVDENVKTLGEIRSATLRLTGYAAQAANPPPGIADMYDEWIRTAQEFLWSTYRPLEMQRFFSWTLTPGIRYYGLRDNRQCCTVALNRYGVRGVWVQDLNNVWWPLAKGIDPTFYTLDQNFGWPTNYEVRQCIEVFPAPQAPYTLWVLGQFDLLPLTEDDDVVSLNGAAVQNYAIFLAKSHKGMKDANLYAAMADSQIGSNVADAHMTRRYIPGTSEVPIPTPPVMKRFEA